MSQYIITFIDTATGLYKSVYEVCDILFHDIEWQRPVTCFEAQNGVISISVDWYKENELYESSLNRKLGDRFTFFSIAPI